MRLFATRRALRRWAGAPAALGLVLALASAGPVAQAQPARQPEVVCDFPAVTVAVLADGTFRSRPEGPLRLTFRDIDRRGGTARVIYGEGASGDEPAAVTVDANAISYLVERAGVSKMVVTTATRPSPGGWAAMLSQHGSSGGNLSLRTATGACRTRAR